MYSLLLATMMGLPIYPLNPMQQDTVNYMNIHVNAGLSGPNSIVGTGPEVSLKYEMMFHHPFILRAALDYRYGKINSTVYPHGRLHQTVLATEVIYYRGTDKLTGYLGAGPVLSTHFFNADAATSDSLNLADGITDISINSAFGYRITAGLRFQRVFSLELGITEISPKFIYRTDLSADRYSESKEEFRFSDFRLSLGYLFTFKK